MRTGYSQQGMIIKVETLMGEDVFLLDSFIGIEYISNPFLFNLEMRSSNESIDISKLINTEVFIKVLSADTPSRYFHGVISTFSQVGIDQEFAYYTAEIVPKFWLLKLGSNRVIFQNVSALDIITNTLENFGIAIEDRTTNSYQVREYCVQHDENYFDFISRLMESEGIFYFFDFNQNGHKMVLADDPSSHKDCQSGEKLFYRAQKPSREMSNTISKFETTATLVTQEVVFSDYNFHTPSTKLLTNSDGKIGSGSYYEYPGFYKDLDSGEHISRIRLQQKQVESQKNSGESLCPVLQAGCAFTLQEFSNSSANIRYVLKSVHHEIKNECYINSFEAFPATHSFRPPRNTAKPFVYGSQSAIVVGPPGEEIWTDSLGRIKVKFFWDRSSISNENSSCWIRVSQTWADTGWGSLFIPRIGQEVIVTFIEGDPDRPIVTGCVYNAERDRPVQLPANQTQSVLRTKPFTKPPEGDSSAEQFITDLTSTISEVPDSTLDISEVQSNIVDIVMGDDRSSRGVGNEIRFEDKTDEEEFYQHAHKDMKIDIENDLTTTVYSGDETHTIEKGDRSVEVSKGNESHLVEGERKVTVNSDEKHINEANFTHSIKENYECKVEGECEVTVTGEEKHINEANFTHSIKGNYECKVDGDYSLEVDGDLKIKVKGKVVIQSLSLDGKTDTGTTLEAGSTMELKAGAKVSVTAPAIALG